MQELGEQGKGYGGHTGEADPGREEQGFQAGEAAGHAAMAGEGGGPDDTAETEDKSVGSLHYYRDNYDDMDWAPEDL